jgi:predicted transcriptional regulator
MTSEGHFEDVLGPLGAAIAHEVVALGEGSVADVVEALRRSHGRTYAYTTVLTVMSRLHDRGVLLRRQQGRHHVYRAAAQESELVDRITGAAVDDVVERYGTAALRHFAVRLGELDPETRRRLMELAEEDR